jgi:hypothetical protein
VGLARLLMQINWVFQHALQWAIAWGAKVYSGQGQMPGFSGFDA